MKFSFTFGFILAFALQLSAQTPQMTWLRHLNSTKSVQSGAIAVDKQGNVFTVGSINGTLDLDPGPGAFNAHQFPGLGLFVQVLDSNGEFKDGAVFRNLQGTGAFGTDIKVDDSGNVFITGKVGGTFDFDPGEDSVLVQSPCSKTGFVLKLDENLDYTWVKTFQASSQFENSTVQSIDLGQNGDIYVCGGFSGTIDFDPGPGILTTTPSGSSDAYFVKLDPSGNLVWLRQIGGTGIDQALDLILDKQSNVYLVGYFQDTVDFAPGAGSNIVISEGKSDVFIQKWTPQGTVIWTRTTGGAEDDGAASIALDKHGNPHLNCWFQQSADFDPGPGQQILNAWTTLAFGAAILSLDPAGGFRWVKATAGATAVNFQDIEVDKEGEIYVSTRFNYTQDIDPGPGIQNLTSFPLGNYDGLILKLDSTGNMLWWQYINCSYSAIKLADITIDQNGAVYATGSFIDSAYFELLSQIVTLVDTGTATGSFVQKIHTTNIPLGTSPLEVNSENLTAFPNPVSDQLQLVSENEEITSVAIYNSLGCQAQVNVSGTGPSRQLDFSQLPSGLYILQVQTTTGMKTVRVMKR